MPIKPYKSLHEVYLAKSFAKPVPALPRQKIFFEKLTPRAPKPGETVQYYLSGFEPDDGYKTPKGTKKGTKVLAYEVPGEEKKGEVELIQLAIKIIGGKGQGTEDAARVIVSKIREIYYNNDKNEEYSNVRSILINLQKPENKIRDLPPEDEKFDLVQEIMSKTNNKYPVELVRALLNTSGKGSTNLGKVELGLTIFYADAKKAAKGGDVAMERSIYNSVPIQIGTITYEVKGPGGRMGDGSDNTALKGLADYMNEFYNKHNINKEYELVDIGGRSTRLITNIYNSINEILKINNSTVQELFNLILKSSPKPVTPENVVAQFFESSKVYTKEDFKSEDFIKKLSTALQMQTYRETDGHKFLKLLAYNDNFNTLVIDVSNFTFLDYAAMLEKKFSITRPESDAKYSAFGITIL